MHENRKRSTKVYKEEARESAKFGGQSVRSTAPAGEPGRSLLSTKPPTHTGIAPCVWVAVITFSLFGDNWFKTTFRVIWLISRIVGLYLAVAECAWCNLERVEELVILRPRYGGRDQAYWYFVSRVAMSSISRRVPMLTSDTHIDQVTRGTETDKNGTDRLQIAVRIRIMCLFATGSRPARRRPL